MELQPIQYYQYGVRDLCMDTLRDAEVDLPRMTRFFDLAHDAEIKTTTISIKRIIADRPFQVLLETPLPDPRGTLLSTFVCGMSAPLGRDYHIYNREMTPIRAHLRATTPTIRIEHITMVVSVVYMDGDVQKNLSQHLYYRKDFANELEHKSKNG